MSLESTSKLRNNIKDLKQKVEHQEKVVSGYQANYDNLRNEVKLLLKLVELNKKLEHESDPKEITKLNNQKQEIFNKIPMMVGRDQAFISQSIRDREILQGQIHTKIDTETEILNDFKTELKDNKGMEEKRPVHYISRRGRNWIVGGAIGLAGIWATSKILSGNDKEKKKDGTEQITPVAPPKDTPKDTPKDEGKDKVKEKPDNNADFGDGLEKNKDRRDGGSSRRKKEPSPEKEKELSPKIIYTLTSPDGKQTKTFNTIEERDAFAKEHNLIVHQN